MADTKKVIISIEVKGKGASSELDKTKKSADRLASATKKLKDLQSQEAIELAKVNQQIRIQKEVNDAAAKSSLGLANATNRSAMAAGAMKTNSGLNNAIIAESARLASDASYGFTAIANNLGQLVSLFSASANAAGGLASSIKALFTAQSIFLISIQLLITYGNDIINFFKGNQKAVDDFNKSLKDLEKTVQSQRMELLGYIEVLKDNNISEKERLNALKELEVASPNIVDTYNKQKTSLEDLTKQVEEYIRQQRLRGELEALLETNQELFVKREKIRAAEQAIISADSEEDRRKILDENTNIFQELEALRQGTVGKKGLIARFLTGEDDVDILKGFQEISKGTIEEYEKVVAKIIEIEKQLTADPDDPSGGAGGRINAAFRAADLDFEVERQRSREKILKSLVKDELFQVDIQMQGVRDRARIKQQEFVQDQKRRFEQFKSRGVSNEQIKEAQAALDKEIRASEEELSSYLIQLDKETARKRADIRLAQNKVIQDRLREQQYAEEIIIQKQDDQEVLNKGIKAGNLLEIQEQQLESERSRIQMSLDAGNLEFKEKERLEKELTRVTNEQASLRIADAEREAMSKRQLLDQVGNALSAFTDLAGKETKAGKALAISSTLVSTYSSAQKAFESQFLPIPTANSPIRGALAAAAAVASGLANVRAIIGETKTAPSKKPSVQVEAPDFNVVGASPESQLAASVAQQQTQPLRAFVVGKDITNQQELDRNIVTTAGL